jgi:hypothetical protein
LEKLSEAFPFKAGAYFYYHGNVVNTIFIWKIDPSFNETKTFEENYKIRDLLKEKMPTFKTRAMRREFVNTCELFLGNVEKARIRRIYKDFVGDDTADDSELDIRVKLAFTLCDPNLITDLRHFNEGRKSIYDTFWEHAKMFLSGVAEDAVIAVDDRRHDPIPHMAVAISVRDLREQIKKRCPEETPIPSIQWLRLQFWPKNKTNLTSLQYTGILPLKFMIQVRQLRSEHIDMHYASALFRYLKELSIKFKDHTWLVFLDDKHRCKIGEPGFPVAAVERGKKVVVANNAVFTVSDHDFTKFSLIPSVSMICEIPDSIEGSFYRGDVYIGLKDAIFQPSSSLRHMTELYDILLHSEKNNPFLMIYTDGGPDHKNTFLRIQLSLIAIFIALDLDYLVALRTPPGHSWKNPVERIMSILNLGMQSVGLMRAKMNDENENLINNCNNIEEIREKGRQFPMLEREIIESLRPTKELLNNVFCRQSLKDRNFSTFDPATKTEMERIFESVHVVDDTITMDDTTHKKVANKVKVL